MSPIHDPKEIGDQLAKKKQTDKKGKPMNLAVENGLGTSANFAVNLFAKNKVLSALVVDDAPENIFLLSKILSSRGIEVESAVDGAEAIQKAMGGDFDFILMDMEMPKIDGYEATKTLREMGYKKPIIALSAHDLPEEQSKMMQSGCVTYLSKPIDFALLFETISKWTRVEIEKHPNH